MDPGQGFGGLVVRERGIRRIFLKYVPEASNAVPFCAPCRYPGHKTITTLEVPGARLLSGILSYVFLFLGS